MPYISEMAADSKVFHRGNTRVPVGVTLGFSDVAQFEKEYDAFFDRAFQGFGKTKS